MRRATAIVVLVLVLAAGCGSGSANRSSTSASGTSRLHGSLTVFAAASLTESFTDLKAALEQAGGVSLTESFAGSGALVAQITNGAPADVVATADESSMQVLVDGGLVDPPATFAHNRLEILVQPGNPKGIHTIGDLGRRDIVFVTEDDTVPAGTYTAQMLAAAGVTTHPVSKEADVKAAVQKVTSGNADATVVYATDVVAAGTAGQGVAIPADQNVLATYPIAVVKATGSREAAQAFVAYVLSATGQQVLEARGFTPGA